MFNRFDDFVYSASNVLLEDADFIAEYICYDCRYRKDCPVDGDFFYREICPNWRRAAEIEDAAKDFIAKFVDL